MVFIPFYCSTERDERDWKILKPCETKQEAIKSLNRYLLIDRNYLGSLFNEYENVSDGYVFIDIFEKELGLAKGDIYRKMHTIQDFKDDLLVKLIESPKIRYRFLAEGYEIAEIEEV